MTMVLFEANVLGTAVMPDRMETMPELDDMITTAEAQELARDMGVDLTRQYIWRSARDGRISGSRKMGEGARAIWVLHRPSFVEWLRSRKPPGRPRSD